MFLAQIGRGLDLPIAALGLAEEGLEAGSADSDAGAEAWTPGPATCLNLQSGNLHFPEECKL